MKKLLCSVFLIILVISVYAQIEVVSNGDVGIGGITSPKGKLHWAGDLYGKGHIYLHSYEGDGENGTAYIQARDKSGTTSIGLQFRTTNSGSIVNALKINPNGDLLKPDGTGSFRIGGSGNPRKMLDVDGHAYFSCYPASSGFYFENYLTTSPIIRPQWGNTAYLGNSSNKFWRVYTYYLHYNYLVQNSDQNIKENIRDIESPLSTICNIRGVTFDFKREYYHNSPEEKMEALIEEGKDNVGFIAQELKEVVPKLVIFNKESELYDVNYVGLIPILVEAIKEQQTIIDNLTDEISEIKTDNSYNLKSALVATDNNLDEQTNISILFQNAPNPFNENTEIKYYISENANQASIRIYDMNGTQLKSYDLHQKENGQVTINGSEFHPGMYLAALLVDGMVIDSKRMILTD